MGYLLLDAFSCLFDGVKYKHRSSNLGDHVASFLYEDIVTLNRSAKLVSRVKAGLAVVNAANVTVGKPARRGDGTFGESVPNLVTVVVEGFLVPRGRIASVEVGAETKILAKAMVKQIDRVISDLRRQVEHFKESNPKAICVGLVGVNHADEYVSFEGLRRFKTDGKKHKHPVQEAMDAEIRLIARAQPAFDELVFLRFRATNIKPYPFSWVDEAETQAEYGAALARISREYESRF